MTNTRPILSALSFDPKPHATKNTRRQLLDTIFRNNTSNKNCKQHFFRVNKFFQVLEKGEIEEYLSSETLIMASSCGIVTAMLTTSLQPSSLFTRVGLGRAFRVRSCSVSLIVAAILVDLVIRSRDYYPVCPSTTGSPSVSCSNYSTSGFLGMSHSRTKI